MSTTDATPTPFTMMARDLGSNIVAEMVRCVAERESVDATADELYAWATQSLDVDELWEEIGTIIDKIEADAIESLGEKEEN